MDPSLLTQRAEGAEDGAAKAQKAAQEEQMRREILATVLDQDARERRTVKESHLQDHHLTLLQ
jgi:DNA-binding TFAR19-related protein (PDSD5 family)